MLFRSTDDITEAWCFLGLYGFHSDKSLESKNQYHEEKS